eukprot:4223088-Pyramimonas_sp.AAC.1
MLLQEEGMREEVAMFHGQLFKGPEDGSLPRWAWQQWGPDCLAALPKKLDAQLMRKFLSRLEPGKTCPRYD